MKISIFLIFFIVLNSHRLLSQSIANDKKMIVASLASKHSQIHPRGGIYGFYKRNISDQIINDCIYEHSCSAFSRGAFSSFGIVKGAFLTIDRLTRCNRASASQILPVRMTKEGRFKDHWEDYARRNKS